MEQDFSIIPVKTRKRVIPQKVFLFFRKISSGKVHSIWFITGTTAFSEQKESAPFFACSFCFAYRKHVIILRRIGSLFCWLKRAHASVNMSSCTLFNKAKKGPNLLNISTWSVLGRQNVQAKKVFFATKISSSLCECWWNRNNIFNRRNR